MPREITVKLTFDDKFWDDYKDVHPELLIEDALGEVAEGVTYEVLSDKTKTDV